MHAREVTCVIRCVDLVCLCGRGHLRPLIDMLRSAGSNGIEFIAETRDANASLADA